MRRFIALVCALGAAALVCTACAQGGSVPAAGSGSITMYGTVDEGVTIRH